MLDPRVVNERTVVRRLQQHHHPRLAQIENCTDGSCSLDDSPIRSW